MNCKCFDIIRVYPSSKPAAPGDHPHAHIDCGWILREGARVLNRSCCVVNFIARFFRLKVFSYKIWGEGGHPSSKPAAPGNNPHAHQHRAIWNFLAMKLTARMLYYY